MSEKSISTQKQITTQTASLSSKLVLGEFEKQALKTGEKALIAPQKQRFQDKLPELLKNNPFDQAVTFLRGFLDTYKLIDAVDNIVYWNSWAALRIGFKALFQWKAYGSLNFPEFGPTLLVSNHQSVLDPFLVATAVTREIRWISKIENFNMPIFKSILSFFGTMGVNREENPTVILDRAVDKLNNGECVGIFPEGTRSEDGTLGEFKTGAARIVLMAGVPYVPCCILGSRNVLPKNSVNMKLSKVEIRVGEPVFLDFTKYNINNSADVHAIATEMRKKIDDLMKGELDPSHKYILTPDMPEMVLKAKAKELDLSIR
jgi:1-acyl-sn-glycerol-3-phosphate acyltransferase